MMQVAKDPSKYKICKVVQQNELEAHTRAGWELIAVLGGSSPIDRHLSASMSSGHNSSQYGSVDIPGVIQTVSFLLGFDETSSMAQLEEELRTLRTVKAELVRLKGELEDQVGRRLGVEGRLKLSNEGFDVENKRRAQAQELARKLEGDIAKIEQDIGGAKMREILSRG